MRFATLALAGALLLSSPLAAISAPYTLDKSHAHVTFEVGHLGFSTVHGQFRKFDANIKFDPDDVEATQVNFVIDAASVDTLWEKRDDHIRGKDFLDVANHPEITFVTKTVTPTGAETADVLGDLTIRGVTQPVTFQAKLNKMGPSPFNPNQTIAGFTVTGQIDRTKYGVSYAAPAVSAIIPIQIELEMSPATN
ncbi:MAG: YceI family protein [Pseudomonadota bacterium]